MSVAYMRRGPDRFEGSICSMPNGFVSVSSLQTKVVVMKTGKRGRGSLQKTFPHNSDLYTKLLRKEKKWELNVG